MVLKSVGRHAPELGLGQCRGIAVAEYQHHLRHRVRSQSVDQSEKVAPTTRDGDGDMVCHSPKI